MVNGHYFILYLLLSVIHPSHRKAFHCLFGRCTTTPFYFIQKLSDTLLSLVPHNYLWCSLKCDKECLELPTFVKLSRIFVFSYNVNFMYPYDRTTDSAGKTIKSPAY